MHTWAALEAGRLSAAKRPMSGRMPCARPLPQAAYDCFGNSVRGKSNRWAGQFTLRAPSSEHPKGLYPKGCTCQRPFPWETGRGATRSGSSRLRAIALDAEDTGIGTTLYTPEFLACAALQTRKADSGPVQAVPEAHASTARTTRGVQTAGCLTCRPGKAEAGLRMADRPGTLAPPLQWKAAFCKPRELRRPIRRRRPRLMLLHLQRLLAAIRSGSPSTWAGRARCCMIRTWL